jgi:hypothetical protein
VLELVGVGLARREGLHHIETSSSQFDEAEKLNARYSTCSLVKYSPHKEDGLTTEFTTHHL